jgi:hypothetical protein
MKAQLNLAVFALGVLFFAGAAPGAESGADSNPYRVIYQHSIFGLVPPPTPADVRSAVPPPDIILNGIMNIFGRKYALFKFPANKGKSCLLAEGQTDGEIQLLSVDERAGKIKINNHGVVQTVALSKPPATSSQPAAGAAPNATPSALAGDNPRQSPATTLAPAAFENNSMPVATPVAPAGFYAGAAGGSSGSSPGNSPGDSSSQTSGGSSSTPKPEPEPWWVIGSKSMEAARIATANLVNSGQAEPWPLTPFTPPGTPANLIGPEQLYFGHGVYQGVNSGAIP